MQFIVNSRDYDFTLKKYLSWVYTAGSLLGLQGEWRFTNAGYDALNDWLDDAFGIDLLDDTARRAKEHGLAVVMQSLITSGDAYQSQNNEHRQLATWWETTFDQPPGV